MYVELNLLEIEQYQNMVLQILGIYHTLRRVAYICNELGGNMARFAQFPIMITRSTIIYEITSPGAAGSSIYV